MSSSVGGLDEIINASKERSDYSFGNTTEEDIIKDRKFNKWKKIL